VSVTLKKTSPIDKNKLYKCKVSWNRIVKEIEILILKGFGIVYVKSMV
jgi:hypothetical protein